MQIAAKIERYEKSNVVRGKTADSVGGETYGVIHVNRKVLKHVVGHRRATLDTIEMMTNTSI